MNFIEALFLRFYCLDLSKIVALLICATVIYHLLRKLFEKYVWWRSAVRVTFLLYCAVIITATVVSRECDIIEPSLMPFASYLEMKASGNVEIIRRQPIGFNSCPRHLSRLPCLYNFHCFSH